MGELRTASRRPSPVSSPSPNASVPPSAGVPEGGAPANDEFPGKATRRVAKVSRLPAS
ncbi:hypothetical protein ABZ826_10445 [Streptomyces sp. NPDC047515]|uniref:hypothetical protein n=1 Tax=Streptomyces sp. NPDC047515 TaxID=3155380 RepID=UPI0033F1EB25